MAVLGPLLLEDAQPVVLAVTHLATLGRAAAGGAGGGPGGSGGVHAVLHDGVEGVLPRVRAGAAGVRGLGGRGGTNATPAAAASVRPAGVGRSAARSTLSRRRRFNAARGRSGCRRATCADRPGRPAQRYASSTTSPSGQRAAQQRGARRRRVERLRVVAHRAGQHRRAAVVAGADPAARGRLDAAGLGEVEQRAAAPRRLHPRARERDRRPRGGAGASAAPGRARPPNASLRRWVAPRERSASCRSRTKPVDPQRWNAASSGTSRRSSVAASIRPAPSWPLSPGSGRL